MLDEKLDKKLDNSVHYILRVYKLNDGYYNLIYGRNLKSENKNINEHYRHIDFTDKGLLYLTSSLKIYIYKIEQNGPFLKTYEINDKFFKENTVSISYSPSLKSFAYMKDER